MVRYALAGLALNADFSRNYLKKVVKLVAVAFLSRPRAAWHFAPKITQKLLRFVQRGRILLRCGSASRYRCPPWAFPP
jgi:hypothetical protein